MAFQTIDEIKENMARQLMVLSKENFVDCVTSFHPYF